MNWIESLNLQVNTLKLLLNDEDLFRDVENLIAHIKKVRGFIYFTGIGKNGHVAQKVSSTFNSLGIRSQFIDPVNTLHGDMYIFNSQDDMLIALSKSGETEELLTFVRVLKNMPFDNIIAVTSNRQSTLSKLSKMSVVVRVDHEADHLNLAPVASSLAYMAVLQAIAVQISSERGFDKRQFVRGHPGGTLGKTKVD
ncbi:MAG: SIS domain-containing protein [Candidatus Micrarchaeota archaeon]|nr:SIS domain-containing protein [Candidatus Micrarchaeota archaeon]